VKIIYRRKNNGKTSDRQENTMQEPSPKMSPAVSASADKPLYQAAVLIIGNEILSGRTQDANLIYLANQLKSLGIRLMETRIVPDIAGAIISAVNALRTSYSYVFTTGGIGPTHDDITAQAIADAFGLPLHLHPEAQRRLQEHYGTTLNAARLKMAYIPQGAQLLDNPVSRAPGFQCENVFVLPGVPSILQAMFAQFRHRLVGGAPLLARTIAGTIAESLIAAELAAIEAGYEGVEIGSYPYFRQGKFGTSLVVRGAVLGQIEAAAAQLVALLARHGVTADILEGEG
jgi:molybdenum cofactor synthesis domain-containing protein